MKVVCYRKFIKPTSEWKGILVPVICRLTCYFIRQCFGYTCFCFVSLPLVSEVLKSVYMCTCEWRAAIMPCRKVKALEDRLEVSWVSTIFKVNAKSFLLSNAAYLAVGFWLIFLKLLHICINPDLVFLAKLDFRSQMCQHLWNAFCVKNKESYKG